MAATPEEQPAAPKRRPFRDVALASGLVTAADVEAAEAVALGRLADIAVPETDSDDPTADAGHRRLEEATARVLVEQGKLTRFQAREIQAGRTRFRLGQYTVTDEIGRGGMGQVFEAEHALMGRRVAIKVLPRAKATPESESAFRREMRILGRLDHENLVRAFDAGYDAMVYYLVTELVPGSDLRRLVRRHGPLDATAAASVFSQAARGLAFAHAQRLVHRDVKPGNILVMADGRVKVLDLGLAGSTLEEDAVRLGRIVGTMDYIAPEQIRTPDDVGPPADIYALGCSLYFALTGSVPFPGGSRKEKMRRHLTESPVPIQRLAPHLPPPLCQVVESMMAKSVTNRIGSADEVIRRLAPWAPDRPAPLPRRRREDGPQFVTGSTRSDSGDESRSSQSPDDVGESAAFWGDAVRQDDHAFPGDDSSLVVAVEKPRGRSPASRAVVTAARVLVPSALAGLGFTIALWLIRCIDRVRFEALLGPMTPTTWGAVAFLLMAAAQAFAIVGRHDR